MMLQHEVHKSFYNKSVDTLMGATYLAIAPEHALISQIVSKKDKIDKKFH